MKESANLGAVKAAQRPFKTLWGKAFLDPLAARLVLVLAKSTRISPLALTTCALALALISAALFWQGSAVSLVVGALIFQCSSVSERAGGLLARFRPGSGSPLGLIVAHTVAPWRAIINVLALAASTHASLEHGPMVLVWAALFILVHFLDWTVARIIIKVRGAYRTMYEPRINSLDRSLIALKERAERAGLKLALFGVEEKALLVLTLAPVVWLVPEMLIATVVLGTLFFVLRLRLDIALVKDTIVNDVHHRSAEAQDWPVGADSEVGVDRKSVV